MYEYETIKKECRIILGERWVFHEDIEAVKTGEGVVKRVLAYGKGLMCVENTFEKGAVDSLYHHSHTQITYVISGEFELNIKDEKRTVRVSDAMLKMDGVERGCICLEVGIFLDTLTSMREDSV